MSQYIEKIYSKIEPDKLLHQVIRREIFEDAKFRIDGIDKDELLQVAILNLSKDQTFKPHKHIYKDLGQRYIAAEAWIIVAGLVKATYFDVEGQNIIEEKVLKEGDITISLKNGGHTYTCLEDNSWIYELKLGPYKGMEWDKEPI